MTYPRNPVLRNPMLPVEIVLAPDWWHRHEGIVFDEDFFFHPARRVEAERRMERVLFERFGRFGLGRDHDKDLPQVGATHLAAGFLVSEMLGCRVEYLPDAPPAVHPAQREDLDLSPDDAFRSPAWKRFEALVESLQARHGGLVGDVNWGGVLNLALDLRGQSFFLDCIDRPEQADRFLGAVAGVIERFTGFLAARTGTTSVSVNRTVGRLAGPVFLHSECSHVMISVADYERRLAPLDAAWGRRFRPFGIHYCGHDPHRFAEAFARLPHLDFLDVGWGGDVARLRACLPHTFLNVRYSPVEIARQTPDEIRRTVRRLVLESGNPYLTGVCCINMDGQVTDGQIAALLEETEALRGEYEREEGAE